MLTVTQADAHKMAAALLLSLFTGASISRRAFSRCATTATAAAAISSVVPPVVSITAPPPSSLTDADGAYIVDAKRAAAGLEDPLIETEGAYSTISAALAVAPSGAKVIVRPGLYMERLTITRPVSLLADPGAVVNWKSDKPYEAALTIDLSDQDEKDAGTTCLVSGLTIRHYSKSIAQNYCVFVPAPSRPASRFSKVEIRGCDISSESGSGVGVEGGDVSLAMSKIASCKNHGVLFLGKASRGSMRECLVEKNGLSGVLLRDGASPVISSNRFLSNGQYGAALFDCNGRLAEDNTFKGNSKGAVQGECDDEAEQG